MKLAFTMVYTVNIEPMTRFYREGLGLEPANASPFFVEFATGPTSFALLAIPPGHEPQFEQCFMVDNIEAAVLNLRARGMEFTDDIKQQEFGKVIHMRDPESNVISLLQSPQPSAARGEPELSTVIINNWDFGRATMFYRERLGLPVLSETPHWVELETGGAKLAIHARAERPDLPAHGKQRVACSFDIEDLEAFVERLGERGTSLATDPTEEVFGTYAEVVDPDGNLVVFRQPPALVPVPETVAEAYEVDTPQHIGMRKQVKKRSKAVSRVVLKPAYKGGGAKAKAKAGAKAKKAAASNGKPKKVGVASVRGGGPERTRHEPRKLKDPKRAKTKPAIGRLRKAERRTLTRKKQAVAVQSRSRPVKRAAAKKGRGR